ncbi:RagB/SusD family nutrient uptake outer membrane protein [Seonamhaeicola sp. S2-3]|uniref:RagB/SusD family nutrient uptake outer membrane protein n=1 Tax=Seonamhaeicola sp. S2-3 TaxID=1936081 RepID=UPI000972CAE9|nr:RagB/SusD family nutrient uptake outer membrane protein [Seonamhaeicola sp. S2-3]APY12761.1 RagB/SusD family nutrient uptake outer membrane protein [Seonamhaeicola sp. S2-3]
MKQSKYIKSLLNTIGLVLICLTQSCDKFLEQEPGSQTSISEQLSSKDGVLEALLGAYTSLESTVRSERYAIYADLQGGNLKFSPNLSSSSLGELSVPINLENVYNFQDLAQSSDLESIYDDNYDIINQVNLILEYVDALTDATSQEINQIKAQALTIRAYCHFLLAQIYAQNYNYTTDASHLGIVYNTTTLTNGITYPSRETAFATYALIVNDLTEALNFYNDANILEGPEYSYFNLYNTKAFLARVYLTQQDWQNAYDMANDVILNSGVTLVSSENYISEWEKTDTPVSEILLEFSVPRDSGDTVGGSMSAFYGYTSDSDYEKYVASEDLLNLFETTDIRKELFLEQPLATLINNELEDVNYYFTKKFQDNAAFVGFRLSELYLIRAEASIGLENFEDAKDDINVIRERAKASLLTSTDNLEELLLEERRKEFCFESQYLFDLSRNQQDIIRNDGCISQTCNLNYPSDKFILPIPQDNIDLNENLQQNASY